MVGKLDERMPNFWDQFQGVLVGTAVGDALGLPAEGLNKQRISRRWQGEWKHRLLFGRGMKTDCRYSQDLRGFKTPSRRFQEDFKNRSRSFQENFQRIPNKVLNKSV